MATRFDVLISLADALAYGPHLSESLRYLRKAQCIRDTEQLRNRIQQIENTLELTVYAHPQSAHAANMGTLQVSELDEKNVLISFEILNI